MDPATFSTNLYLSCKSNSIIREDGTALTVFDRISDFFHRKHGHDHFVSVCKNASQHTCIEKIKALPKEEQLEIIGRIRQIQKKITDTTSKAQCDTYIQKVESALLSKDLNEVKQYADAAFNKILACDKNKNNHPDDLLRNVEEIIQFYSNDPEAISAIISSFRNCLNQIIAKPDEERFNFFYPITDKIIERLYAQEERLLKDQKPIDDKQSKDFPFLLKLKLEILLEQKNEDEIKKVISNLEVLMDKNSDNPVFIKECLAQLDLFLKIKFFHEKSLSLPESGKKIYLLAQSFFTIFDKHLPRIADSDPTLAMALKIKCANLPCQEDRSLYPNLVLKERDLVRHLSESLQHREDLATSAFCEFLQKKAPWPDSISSLAKLVGVKSLLSPENRLKIREAIKLRLEDKSPKDWDKTEEVTECLRKFFEKIPAESSQISYLKRVSKAKLFFDQQKNYDENMIMIPRWYYETTQINMKDILTSGRLYNDTFRGTWVSTKSEEPFGSYTLSLTNRIIDLAPRGAISYEAENNRLRDIQKAVHFRNAQDMPQFALISVPSREDKAAQKTDKLALVKILKEKGFPFLQVISPDQLVFMQKQILEIIGTPNLPESWWRPDF